MSLYHEAATVVDKASSQSSGSIQSIVFGKKDWKSPPKTLFALACETAKWSRILADVIDRSSILGAEKQLTPTLALVLVHDLLLAKRGISLPSTHGLAVCIARHKARLNAELTKARIREGCSTILLLQKKIEAEATGDLSHSGAKARHPRWIRINRVLTTLEQEMASTFAEYEVVESLADLWLPSTTNNIYHDAHIPDLVAVRPSADLSSSKAYKEGRLIFQDKASCFPAYLSDFDPNTGLAVDACAAPGNKTTHLAAIAFARLTDKSDMSRRIFACEKDPLRSQTLAKMVKSAGADQLVQVKQKQNFLKLEPNAAAHANVTTFVLDPSCSGSGIVGRDEGGVKIYMPTTVSKLDTTAPSKKRKRGQEIAQPAAAATEEEQPIEETAPEKLQARLASLSEFQLRLLLHAMSFPAATRITYSTCSVHAEENENVVFAALSSDVASSRGWRILLRANQVDGLRKWHVRGDKNAVQRQFDKQEHSILDTAEDVANACIRCEKSGSDGTMGFFVAAFTRNPALSQPDGHLENEDEDWSGFEEG